MKRMTVIIYPEDDIDEIIVVGDLVDLNAYTLKGQLVGPLLKDAGVAVRVDLRLLLTSLEKMNIVEIVNGPALEEENSEQSH
jgi:hypothetical protein